MGGEQNSRGYPRFYDWLLEVEGPNPNPMTELKQTKLDEVVKVLTNKKAGNTPSTGKTEQTKKAVFKFNKKGKLRKKERDEIQRKSKNIFNLFSKGSLTHPTPRITIWKI